MMPCAMVSNRLRYLLRFCSIRSRCFGIEKGPLSSVIRRLFGSVWVRYALFGHPRTSNGSYRLSLFATTQKVVNREEQEFGRISFGDKFVHESKRALWQWHAAGKHENRD